MRTLLLALFLAGGLAAGTSQSHPAAQPAQAIEPLVGTLELEAAHPGALDYPRATSARPFAGWLFINGELRGTMPLTQRFMLAPGSYEVRAVVAARGDGGVQYWTARWPRVVIGQGATFRLNTNDVLRRFPSTGALDTAVEATATPEPEFRVRNVRITPDTLNAVWKAAVEDFRQKKEAFTTGSVFKYVEAARQQLQREPPTRPRIWIEMPPELGGAREFDVDQLRVLQEYLRPNIGGWSTAIPFLPDPVSKEFHDAVRKLFDGLKNANEEVAKEVAAAFDEIVAALEKARNR